MILASIEIENYKQYGGSHQIDFPEQGMIAITGPNGAGKTTLFEAIEWCLYGPRAILLGTIPPHGGVGLTRVRVTLQDANDGRRYVVQRVLKNGVSSAEAYAEDDPGQPVVQGPRDVTDYVAKQLVGLPHGAFVSTFFTRQKELTFFGDRTPTDRRVEVARLLGFETIRDAQEDIGIERHQARQATLSLCAQYDRDSADRDLAQEIEHATSRVAAAEALASASQGNLADADAAYTEAREGLDRWRELQEQDAAHEKELLTCAGAVQAATSRRHAAEAELNRLLALGEERMPLAQEAARVDDLLALVASMEVERERARRLETLRLSLRGQTEQLAAAAGSMRQIVEAHQEAAAGLDGWYWADGDAEDPRAAASRLGQTVAAVDQRGVRQHAELLRRALDLATRIETATKNLDHYRSFRANLAGQRDALPAGADPAARLRMAEAEAVNAQAALEDALGELTEARREREESAELERIFDARSFNRVCPTCSRSLTDEEAAGLLRSLHGSTQRLRENESAREQHVVAARARVTFTESDRTAAAELLRTIASLNERLTDGERMIAELESEHARDLADLQATLTAAGLATPPGAAQIEAAQVAADRATRMAALGGTLEQLGQRAAGATQGLCEAEHEIAALGTVTYDASAHQATVRLLESARHAAAELKRIDIELRAEAGYQTTKSAAERELDDLDSQSRAIQAARVAVGFDGEALRQARAVEIAAGLAQGAAREEAVQARDAYRDAQAALQRLGEERQRLQQLAEAADRRGREADELERMHREFAEFDKFVADHVGPLLAETTERLLSLVTHGKYDRVRFDESYGIEVFDGDECFKLEGFSGGERDVVALCARLAMSELVGSAAVRPPRFLVLDEVFGSLDSERRAQLLETLGSLASSGHFQQMFIISHVDDVQLSPVMNEAWTIEERDGVSHVIRPELLSASLV